VEVLDVSPALHTVRIRISPRVNYTPLTLQHTKDTLSVVDVESGSTNFDEAHVFCAEGAWPYTKRERSEEAIFEVTYPLARGTVTVNWSVEDQPITNASGWLLFWGKEVAFPTSTLGKTVTNSAKHPLPI
jgi:hypothetical protein